eukprot:gnl/Dysnectes_brevis/2435_a2898_1325.p1 GENE.gnl/Dysnectes_brevis/2435_a2898_1325~~gnl/Dysnectes_brevis/2435_a2898_1325.p1  ORF type:complete len:1476 (+),score=163.58 gnl/Dysnectes_brevis/2435_a2898_1325:352-4428(+)
MNTYRIVSWWRRVAVTPFGLVAKWFLHLFQSLMHLLFSTSVVVEKSTPVVKSDYGHRRPLTLVLITNCVLIISLLICTPRFDLYDPYITSSSTSVCSWVPSLVVVASLISATSAEAPMHQDRAFRPIRLCLLSHSDPTLDLMSSRLLVAPDWSPSGNVLVGVVASVHGSSNAGPTLRTGVPVPIREVVSAVEDVHVRSRNGFALVMRALMDTGSDVNLMDASAAQQFIDNGEVTLEPSTAIVSMANCDSTPVKGIINLDVTRLIRGLAAGERACLTFHVLDSLHQETPMIIGLDSSFELNVYSKNEPTPHDGVELPEAHPSIDVKVKTATPREAIFGNTPRYPKLHGVRSVTAMPLIPDSPIKHLCEAICREFASLFQPNLSDQPADLASFSIILFPETEPVSIPPRRLAPKLREVVRDQVEQLLKLGLIRPSVSNWSSPIVMVRKKNGSWRMCVDYRALNQRTVGLKFPLPRIPELIDLLAGKKYFATLDLVSGYHQCAIDAASQPLTAFVTPDGLYEWTRLPFGLKNAPSHFQKSIQDALSGLLYKACLVFIDDIVIFGETAEEFLSNLRAVFTKLATLNLVLSALKCTIGAFRIEYLGFIITHAGIEISPARKQGITDMHPPSNPSELRSFLGMVSYCRRFIPNLSRLAAPLNKLLKKGEVFVFGPEQLEAFDAIKTEILHDRVLAQMNYEDEAVVQTDASKHGLGAVLLLRRTVDGEVEERIVAFISQSVTETQSRWSINELESYAIVWAIEKFDCYLRGHHFLVETDHRNLVFIERATSPKIVRWRMKLEEYVFIIKHIPGAGNGMADALSRVGHSSPPAPRSSRVRMIRIAQASSSSSDAIINGNPAVSIRSMVALQRKTPNEYFLKLGASRANPQSPWVFQDCIVIPEKNSKIILRWLHHAHGSIFSGHRGVEATCLILKDLHLWWVGMRKMVTEFVTHCCICQKVRLRAAKRDLTFGQRLSEGPWDIVAMDLIGPIPADPTTPSDKRYIVVAIDLFSRFVEMDQIKGKSAAVVQRFYFNHIICRYGPPTTIQTDRGGEFTHNSSEAFHELVGSVHHLTLPYHPQGNGAVERANAEVTRHLRAILQDQQDISNWIEKLPLAQYLVNTTVSRATGFSPFEVMFGTDSLPLMRRGSEAISKLAAAYPSRSSMSSYLKELQESTSSLRRRVAARQQAVYASRVRPLPKTPAYMAGDQVWMCLDTPWSRPTHKLACKRLGPVTVVDSSATSVTIKRPDGQVLTRHRSHFSPVLQSSLNQPSAEFLERMAQTDSLDYEISCIVSHRCDPAAPRRAPLTPDIIEVGIVWVGWEDSVYYQKLSTLEYDHPAVVEYLQEHPELAAAVASALVGKPVVRQ